MSACYQLILLYADHPDVAQAICDTTTEELRKLRVEISKLRILRNPEVNEIDHDVPTVCLFIGSKAAKRDPALTAVVERLFKINTPVVPLLVAGEQFDEVIPKTLHPINRLEWKDSHPSAKVTGWLLRLVGLTEKQRRVFVSYRRSDALHMGEQVWEELSKAGFDVFLDRFGIDPAANFQERLTERLGDKAFMLLIESPEARNSKWVMYEVDYALKHRLGFMTLTWPETKKRDWLVENIFEGYRTYLTDDELVKPDGHTRLTAEFIEKLTDQVESIHAAAMLRRRRQLLDSIIVELRRNKLTFTQLSDWTVVVEGAAGGGQKHRIVSVTPRPPEVPDLYFLDRHSNDYKRAEVDEAVLVHSTFQFGSERRELLSWVVGSRNLKLRSEDQIADLVIDLARNK